jgi:hypothetical protein
MHPDSKNLIFAAESLGIRTAFLIPSKSTDAVGKPHSFQKPISSTPRTLE